MRGIMAVSLGALGSMFAALAQDKITIGIVSATSGPFAAPGKFQISGFNLAATEVNKKGGIVIAGKPYQIEYDETHRAAAEAALAMERLTSVDKVPVVLGEVCSPAAAAEGGVAKDAEVPLILTVPTAENLTEPKNDNPYLSA